MAKRSDAQKVDGKRRQERLNVMGDCDKRYVKSRRREDISNIQKETVDREHSERK